MTKKGIVLAGGTGSRLYPITKGISKQLMPIYDKPMVFYPLSVLMLAEIRDILVICTPDHLNNFQQLLGDGSSYGLRIKYEVQQTASGIADAFIIGEDFIGSDDVCLILGDNIFHGVGLSDMLHRASCRADGATIFASHVPNPERFGVLELDAENKVLSIEEKPKKPKSNFAITGIYFYDNNVIKFAKNCVPSGRGELEISDINQMYLNVNKLQVEVFSRGFTWLDTGTISSMMEASNLIETIEHVQGLKVACLEEIAYNNGWIGLQDITNSIENYNNSEYALYLGHLVKRDT